MSIQRLRREQTLEPLTKRRQRADEYKHSARTNPGSPQHFQPGSVVVVLGVMYPSVLPQLVEANTCLDLVPLAHGLVTGRQSVDVVFYDPLSSCCNGKEVPRAPEHGRNIKSDGHVKRTEAQKAVARDLALLWAGKRKYLPPLDGHHFRRSDP
jgi:hypothetical protein